MDIFSTSGIQTSSMIPRPVGAQTTDPMQMRMENDRHMQIASTPPDPNKVVTNFSDALNEALTGRETGQSFPGDDPKSSI